MTLTPEDQFILGCVKLKPTQADINRLNDLIPQIQDWENLLKITVERGIGPLMYKKLSLLKKQNLISEKQRNILEQVYFMTLRRSMLLHDAYKKIVEKFTENSLRVIPLKGIFLSDWLYGDIGLRQCSDIDLLIKPEEGLIGVSLLKEMGYASKETEYISDYIESKSNNVHFPPMILKLVSVELHTKLHGDTESYRINPEACWENAVKVTINGVDSYGLDMHDLLIHLCVHLDKHFREGNLQFTCFNDITNLLDKYSQTLDWKKFIDRCRQFNCEQEVMKYLVLVHKYFYVEIPEELFVKYETLLTREDEELFYKYLHGYSFKIETKTAIPAHLANLNKMKSVNDYFNYFFQIIFPPKKFMIQKYGLVGSRQFMVGSGELVVGSHQKVLDIEQQAANRKQQLDESNLNYKLLTTNYKLIFWWLWYPYRWWVGVKGVVNLVLGYKK